MKRQEKAVKRVRLQTSLYCHDISAPTHFTPTAAILFTHTLPHSGSQLVHTMNTVPRYSPPACRTVSLTTSAPDEVNVETCFLFSALSVNR